MCFTCSSCYKLRAWDDPNNNCRVSLNKMEDSDGEDLGSSLAACKAAEFIRYDEEVEQAIKEVSLWLRVSIGISIVHMRRLKRCGSTTSKRPTGSPNIYAIMVVAMIL